MTAGEWALLSWLVPLLLLVLGAWLLHVGFKVLDNVQAKRRNDEAVARGEHSN